MQFLIQFSFFVAFIEFLHLNPVVVVSSDLNLYKTVPIKPLSDQECGRYCRFLVLKCSDKILLFLLKQKCASHFTEKPPLSIFKEKMADLAFKDIVVNQTSHSVNEKNYLKIRNP